MNSEEVLNEAFDKSRIVAAFEAAGANATQEEVPMVTATMAEMESFIVMNGIKEKWETGLVMMMSLREDSDLGAL